MCGRIAQRTACIGHSTSSALAYFCQRSFKLPARGRQHSYDICYRSVIGRCARPGYVWFADIGSSPQRCQSGESSLAALLFVPPGVHPAKANCGEHRQAARTGARALWRQRLCIQLRMTVPSVLCKCERASSFWPTLHCALERI
jgi:hypothetical protein